jgi:hypothetical protein
MHKCRILVGNIFKNVLMEDREENGRITLRSVFQIGAGSRWNWFRIVSNGGFDISG